MLRRIYTVKANRIRKWLDKGRAFFSVLMCLSLLTPGLLKANTDLDSLALSQLRSEHQQALELSLNYPERGRVEHARIAEKLEGLTGNQEINQGALAYNIGNSWFHAGRYGDSILWYRRAQEQGYSTSMLEHNLNFVRSERLDDLPEMFGDERLSELYGWSGMTPWLLFSGLVYLAFWLQAWRFIRLGRTERGRFISVSAAMLLVSVSMLFRLGYQPPQSDGVITAVDSMARKGPGVIFAPAFTSPLNQGTEFILLQQQDKWWQVQLSAGDQVWLPANSLELVSS